MYLTELNEHVIIQGNEKTLFMTDGMKIKTLNEDEDHEQLVDEEGNFVDMDGNIVEIGILKFIWIIMLLRKRCLNFDYSFSNNYISVICTHS